MDAAVPHTELHEEIAHLRAQVKNLREEMTRQQALEQALREREERYRKIIEYSNDAIFLIDLERNQILDANPTACRMLGYSRNEILALSLSAIHPQEMPQLRQFARSVLARGAGWTDELSCRTKHGTFLPAEISASMVEIDGRTCVLALVRDTSERREAEQRIRQEAARADALARVAERLNAQLDLETISVEICQEIMNALNVPAAVLLFFDRKNEVFYPVATGGLPSEFKQKYIPNPRSVYDQYPQHGAQIVVPNLRALPNLVNADLFEDYNIYAIAIASLNREDHLLGALSAYAFDPDHIFSEDDISLLRSLADLAAQAVRNAILYQAEQRRSEQFRIIGEVGRQLTSILTFDELIFQIAHLTHDAFQYGFVALGLVEDDEIYYPIGIGYEPRPPDPVQRPSPRFSISKAEGLTGWVAKMGQPILSADVTQDPRFSEVPHHGEIRSELIVPIKVQGRVLGVLCVESVEPNAFDEEDMTVVQLLADQAAVAIENARLYEQTRQLAVLEERQRLARELHDSVTQSLYGMTLYTAAASDLLSVGDADTAMNHLHVMQDTVQLALREMRLLIFQLRSPSLSAGLAAALQERLESVEQRSGVKTEFICPGMDYVDSRTEEELYRIAQEALNNALKHAQAQTVRVCLQQNEQDLCLEIADNGRGFDPAAGASNGGMGLRSMQERAAQIDGKLSINSHPNEGTTLRVNVRLT